MPKCTDIRNVFQKRFFLEYASLIRFIPSIYYTKFLKKILKNKIIARLLTLCNFFYRKKRVFRFNPYVDCMKEYSISYTWDGGQPRPPRWNQMRLFSAAAAVNSTGSCNSVCLDRLNGIINKDDRSCSTGQDRRT